MVDTVALLQLVVSTVELAHNVELQHLVLDTVELQLVVEAGNDPDRAGDDRNCACDDVSANNI